jgi:PAS domain S-box-containing protein
MDTLFHRIFLHQNALENQKRFAEWMIDQLPVIIVILDKHGSIKHMNQAAQQAFGRTIDDVLNYSFFSTFLDEPDSAKYPVT